MFRYAVQPLLGRRNREPMHAATTNGALSTADSAAASGQSPLISPLRTVIAVTWLGMMTTVQSHARPVERDPMAADNTSTHGMPIIQYCSLSHASLRPLDAWMASSSAKPATRLAMRTARDPMTTGLSAVAAVPGSDARDAGGARSAE